jgi:hypothetical protein
MHAYAPKKFVSGKLAFRRIITIPFIKVVHPWRMCWWWFSSDQWQLGWVVRLHTMYKILWRWCATPNQAMQQSKVKYYMVAIGCFTYFTCFEWIEVISHQILLLLFSNTRTFLGLPRCNFRFIYGYLSRGYRRASFLWQVFMWQVLFAKCTCVCATNFIWQVFIWQVLLC